jgi:hypothetical protein
MNKKNAPETVKEETALTVQEPQSLDKPQHDTEFAHASAKMLMDIVRVNNWAKRLGGSSDHLQYEAWQTVGKYYSYTVRTHDAEYVELGGTWGFKAKATVVNEITGVEVGSADAFCMSDEQNWRSKPKFQLASMAQTRAGSKALRQILGFVVALAGYNPTPAEEMTPETLSPRSNIKTVPAPVESEIKRVYNETTEKEDVPVIEAKLPVHMITPMQKTKIMTLLPQKGKTLSDLEGAVAVFEVESYQDLTLNQANKVIEKLESLPNRVKETVTEDEVDLEEVDKGIEQMRMKN